ncbi:MAG: hypothetical protein QM767_05040 [Anaeromyxobacter sp.]
MPLPGHPAARGHLRLATAPTPSRPAASRAVLTLRALAALVVVIWMTLLAWFAATLALLPLVWRRGPAGRRLTPTPQREARVIPLQPRRSRQALPR